MIQNTPDQLGFEARENRREEIFQNHAALVAPGESFIFDMNVNIPCYVLVGMERSIAGKARRPKYALNGRLSFLDEDMNYFYPKGPRSGVWHHIEPKNVKVVEEHLDELQAPTIDRPYMWGYLVPLRDSSEISGWIDANALLHNLMFWESMLNSEDTGPLMRQILWLAENAYQLEGAVQRGVAKVSENPAARRSIDRMEAADVDKLMHIIQEQQLKIEELRNFIMHNDAGSALERHQVEKIVQEAYMHQRELNQSMAHMSDIGMHMKQMLEVLANENARMQIKQEEYLEAYKKLTTKLTEIYGDRKK